MIHIAHFQINPDDRSVKNTQSGAIQKLEPKTMAVLLLLIEREGQVVGRDEFMQTVWSGSFTVEESLTRCISELRKVFNDEAKNPQFIKTIHAKGYQLLVEATQHDTPSAKRRVFTSDTQKGAYLMYACIMVLVVTVVWIFVAWLPLDQQAHSTAELANKEEPFDSQQVIDDVMSLKNLPSTLIINDRLRQNSLNINVQEAQETSLDEALVDIQITDNDGLLVWRGVRRFDSQAQRMTTAQDLVNILVKLKSARPAPEIKELSQGLQAQYQHALYLIDRRGEDNLNKAIEILEGIVTQRSDFVMAFVQQALAVRSLSFYKADMQMREKLLIRYDLLLKQALAISPEHPVVKAVSYQYDVNKTNFAEYEQALKSSVEYAPACTICVRELAEFYLHLGYFDKAAKLVEKHLEYFPLSILMHSYLAIVYSHQGDIEGADYQAQIIEALGENRGFDAASVKVQVAMMRGDASAYIKLRKALMEQHPTYHQHAQVIDAILENNIEEARRMIKTMPFLDFNLALSAGMFDELLARINNNLADGSIRDFKFIHGYLNPESFLQSEYTQNSLIFKNSAEVSGLFEELGMFSYWQENNQWPDYCRFIEYQSHRPNFCPQ
jgi:DNA-binding winged helix-turn-helix (wHTH) protein/tetratricopeptide (TPR) repeat protein